VVAAVRGGLLSIEEACSRYMLTVDEFLSWQSSIDQHGLAGLRTTRVQEYRRDGGLKRSALRHTTNSRCPIEKSLAAYRVIDCHGAVCLFLMLGICR